MAHVRLAVAGLDDASRIEPRRVEIAVVADDQAGQDQQNNGDDQRPSEPKESIGPTLSESSPGTTAIATRPS